jgi:hypothetical protein
MQGFLGAGYGNSQLWPQYLVCSCRSWVRTLSQNKIWENEE